jgi:hypothetical protein
MSENRTLRRIFGPEEEDVPEATEDRRRMSLINRG